MSLTKYILPVASHVLPSSTGNQTQGETADKYPPPISMNLIVACPRSEAILTSALLRPKVAVPDSGSLISVGSGVIRGFRCNLCLTSLQRIDQCRFPCVIYTEDGHCKLLLTAIELA